MNVRLLFFLGEQLPPARLLLILLGRARVCLIGPIVKIVTLAPKLTVPGFKIFAWNAPFRRQPLWQLAQRRLVLDLGRFLFFRLHIGENRDGLRARLADLAIAIVTPREFAILGVRFDLAIVGLHVVGHVDLRLIVKFIVITVIRLKCVIGH